MYACLHLMGAPGSEPLLDLAFDFSPHVEQTDAETVTFSIAPLRKLLGSPYQIASEISRSGHERKLSAHLAIAANPDTAVLLAHNCPGVTLVASGDERRQLAGLPLSALPMEAALLQILLRWGVKTCDDLAALSEAGVAERLGPSGVYLRKLALGAMHRPLRIPAPVSNYERRQELENAVSVLEPLLFLLSGALAELCALLRSQARAARQLAVHFDLEDAAPPYRAALEFPVPLTDNRTMLKLLQLHLERHPPAAPIAAFSLCIEPVEPKHVQGGIFLPPVPLPDRLQVTLARIAGMVGEENVGAPELLNTHRPDAFRLTNVNLLPEPLTERQTAEELRLAIRIFRPAREARVHLAASAPKDVAARGVKGKVLRWAGPWKTSGEWWAATAWSREEWDVALDDGGLYRIYRETRGWFVQGVYD